MKQHTHTQTHKYRNATISNTNFKLFLKNIKNLKRYDNYRDQIGGGQRQGGGGLKSEMSEGGLL